MNAKMTSDEIRTIVTANKGEMATVLLTDGSIIEGKLISVNSIGVNVKGDNGKTISRSLSKVQWVEVAGNVSDELLATLDEDFNVIADAAAAVAISAMDPEVTDSDDDTSHTDLNVLTDLPEGTDPFDVNGTDDEDETDPVDTADDDGLEFDTTPGADATDALVAELDGCTTKELAEVFGIEAKELRVKLRALGMGVGKGHRYHLTADQVSLVKDALKA